jgi:CHAT domain-containing protein
LPLHAAGIYDGLLQNCVGNYLVSSYTPTLTALHRLLSIPDDAVITKPSVLLVAESDAANQPSLFHVQEEVDLVQALVPPESVMDKDQVKGMSVDTALMSARNAHIIHLACHGQQDQENPLNSGFELSDGRLTLAQLMQVSVDHAQLAYLSACESAGMDESRPDEGLNLVGTMIFVGFRSVIGTLWCVDLLHDMSSIMLC